MDLGIGMGWQPWLVLYCTYPSRMFAFYRMEIPQVVLNLSIFIPEKIGLDLFLAGFSGLGTWELCWDGNSGVCLIVPHTAFLIMKIHQVIQIFQLKSLKILI